MWIVVAEIIAAIAGFGVAAELTSIGTDRIEPLMGQGMTGGVVLGLLGALPETIFVIIATLSMSYQIALGSALGGNIILFTLGIGIVGLVYSYKWKASVVMKEDYRVELYFLLASTAILAAVIMYGAIDRMSGAVLFMAYFVYLAYRYARAHKRMAFHAGTERGRRIYINGGTYLLAGAVIVVAISGMFVNAISELSGSVGVSALWLALFISPLAADLGENISAVRIAMRNRGGGSTAIVSFIGSKLQNNTMLLGIIGLLAAQSVFIGGARTELVAVIIVNLLTVAVMLRGKLTRSESVMLIIAYAAIIALTFYL